MCHWHPLGHHLHHDLKLRRNRNHRRHHLLVSERRHALGHHLHHEFVYRCDVDLFVSERFAKWLVMQHRLFVRCDVDLFVQQW